MDTSRPLEVDRKESEVDDAFDEVMAVEPVSDFSDMRKELSGVLGSKRPAAESPPQGEGSRRPKKSSQSSSRAVAARRPATRLTPNPEPAFIPLEEMPSAGPSSGAMKGKNVIPQNLPLQTSYPKEVPSADVVSQRALDTLSESSSRIQELLEEEIAKTSRLEKTLSDLAKSHNQLATDHSQLKSMVLRLADKPHEEKRGTSSIRSAREVLSEVGGHASSSQDAPSSSMLPPPRPAVVKGPVVAGSGRPRNKPA